MRYFVRAFVLLLIIVCSITAKVLANPGDTTRVQAQNVVLPDYYNDFNTHVTFPSGSVSYRKIIMVLTGFNVIAVDGGRFAAGDRS